MKQLFSLLLISFVANCAIAQYDLSVSWNEYTTGETIEDNPFLGGFTITNVGETSINAGDTLFYGYLINGVLYDLDLNEGLVSGEILDDDFLPEEDISVYNSFEWPALWESGETILVCAVIFGEGIESYTGDFFTGDFDTTNNKDCVFAVVPNYTVGLDAEQNSSITVWAKPGELVILNSGKGMESVAYQLYAVNGKLISDRSVDLISGENIFGTGDLTPGLYFINLKHGETQVRARVVMQ